MEPEDASQPLAESKEDEEELLACSHCSNPITWREDILQERVNTFKEAVYPYELAVCDKESWCYLATDPQNNRFDLIRTRATAAVRLVASPCEDYSWFPGYAWRAAYCDSCQAQIGWGFCAPFVCGGCETGASSPSSKLWNMAPQFLGVILTRLRPSSQAKAQARFRQFRELSQTPAAQEGHFRHRWWPIGEPENFFRREPPWLEYEDNVDSAFRRARSPTPPMRLRTSERNQAEAPSQEPRSREDGDMQAELLRLLREQARMHRSLRQHQFGTPSNIQPVQSASPRLSPSPSQSPEAEEPRSAYPDSGLLRWLRRLLNSRRQPEARQDSPVRSQEPPDRTWTLIRTLSSQQQHLAAVRDTLLSEQLESSRRMQLAFAQEQVFTHQRTLSQLRELSVRQQQLANEQRQLMEDIIRLQGSTQPTPSQGQL